MRCCCLDFVGPGFCNFDLSALIWVLNILWSFGVLIFGFLDFVGLWFFGSLVLRFGFFDFWTFGFFALGFLVWIWILWFSFFDIWLGTSDSKPFDGFEGSWQGLCNWVLVVG